ncbi:YwqG family protein [Paraflavitalea sp. CAU 1676]|uniref:YwqG family protein n=1 Tax=Paraflavitalea sp. CAU 1676 TaxID=3032598 RepID=UPI0023DA4CBE|nr:YwqG family protein [Paraflavitalea sp. CAU 1676]MDF2192010.1 YwqG family protein [Paraflavitalea sp. CAU 1676]
MKKIHPLHPALKPYKKEIEATLKPVLRISASPAQTGIRQSKFGGVPYWPAAMPYPVHSRTGKPLFHLGQINFGEIPAMNPFPSTGILQFFLNDVSIFDEEFSVIYHKQVINDDDALWEGFDEPVYWERWGGDYALHFEEDVEPVTDEDFRFTRYYGKALQDLIWFPSEKYGYEVRQQYMELHRDLNGRKNKIGGYHYSQNGIDPRPMSYIGEEESELLIQFDGCDVFSWGDLGSANFFIKRRELEELNFADVVYHWDCT